MILRHVKLDELLRRQRDGSTSHYAAVRVDGVPLTLMVTREEYEAFERLIAARVPLVMTIGEEASP